jgi:DNA replication and repair protein RecF
MSLRRLEVRDFRCIESADLELDQRCNLISGANASGKTSLLEAVFFLGRGRSFRTSRNETLIRRGNGELVVSGRVEGPVAGRAVGVRYTRDGFEGKVGGRRVGSLAELATVMPVQAIDPEVHRLIEEGPLERRRYLDWGVFHVEPSFVNQWRRYQRALKQRNTALRAQAADDVVQAWDPELIASGEALAAARRRYFESLAAHVMQMGVRLLGLPVDLALSNGWAADSTLAAALRASWLRDRERMSTQVGPHRADLGVRVGGTLARHHVSRGQQKLTAAAMLLGQLRCDAEWGSPTAAVLVDDPAAELDQDNLERLIEVVRELPGQLFVTALDPSVAAFGDLPAARRFHVEHGKITRLI